MSDFNDRDDGSAGDFEAEAGIRTAVTFLGVYEEPAILSESDESQHNAELSLGEEGDIVEPIGAPKTASQFSNSIASASVLAQSPPKSPYKFEIGKSVAKFDLSESFGISSEEKKGLRKDVFRNHAGSLYKIYRDVADAEVKLI